LYDTISSFPTTDLLCKIIGCKNITPNEMFISNYGKDDFLNIHHDIKKGDVSVTFSLNDNWDSTYGGILHFCDEEQNIYKSIVPKLGSVNIFKIDLEKGINHFVSSVNVNKNRYTFIVWYSLYY
jgi:Rps23 Pro-64 3,4-dihydroxylase Tpa1-like proline 4-hydroxylase